MLKLIIENDDFNVKLIDKNNNEKIINASIDIFNNIDNTLKGMLESLISLNKTNINIYYYVLCMWYGKVPKHDIEYENLTNGDKFNQDKFKFDNFNNEELLTSNIKEIKKSLKNIKINQITTYDCKNNIEIIIACVYHFAKYGHYVNKCECCNNYFITTKKSNEKYCLRINQIEQYQNKKCNEIMALKKRLENQNKEPNKTYRRIYNNILKNYSNEEYNTFMNDSSIIRDKYKNKEISLKEYLDWLNSYDKHKKD